MAFRISALDPEPFAPLFSLDEAALAECGARLVVADAPGAYPCRASLVDAEPGEELLLVNYEHQPADSPFRSRHAIYVRRNAVRAVPAVGEVPEQIRSRILSLRAFNEDGMIVAADLVDGREVEPMLDALLERPETVYVHIHFAKYGCYAARADRT